MKEKRKFLGRGLWMFLVFTFICGGVYTGVVTVLAQLLFPKQANGSIIEIDGEEYGSALLGQYADDENHMWGRIMNI
ncbi:MAG: potassium-transporting ATPase subunit C, partial [Roseburia sp.]|nr:potassium-transporting ATPase subunit C [Roseburia sp.]